MISKYLPYKIHYQHRPISRLSTKSLVSYKYIKSIAKTILLTTNLMLNCSNRLCLSQEFMGIANLHGENPVMTIIQRYQWDKLGQTKAKIIKYTTFYTVTIIIRTRQKHNFKQIYKDTKGRLTYTASFEDCF